MEDGKEMVDVMKSFSVGSLTLALVWERLRASFVITFVMLVFKKPTLWRSVNEYVRLHGFPQV